MFQFKSVLSVNMIQVNLVFGYISPSFVISNHFWCFEIPKHSVFMLSKFLCVYVAFHDTWCLCCCFYVLSLDSCIVASEFILVMVYQLVFLLLSLCDRMFGDNNGGDINIGVHDALEQTSF